ncbi:MAG TPA: myxococcus cysteine-rich repeat containing protein [Candidatus Nanoarchaeia archaeon]|nr:myxococcus cysteine-rich repeat containing protein [Candidatus Nanoarchaeia archaeon]
MAKINGFKKKLVSAIILTCFAIAIFAQVSFAQQEQSDSDTEYECVPLNPQELGQQLVDEILGINRQLEEIVKTWCLTSTCTSERFTRVLELLEEREELLVELAKVAPQRISEVSLSDSLKEAIKRLKGVKDLEVDERVESQVTEEGVTGPLVEGASSTSSSARTLILYKDGCGAVVLHSDSLIPFPAKIKVTGFKVPEENALLVIKSEVIKMPETPPSISDCAVCGNNRIEIGESCDDGNVVNGDGCSSKCAKEGSECRWWQFWC